LSKYFNFLCLIRHKLLHKTYPSRIMNGWMLVLRVTLFNHCDEKAKKMKYDIFRASQYFPRIPALARYIFKKIQHSLKKPDRTHFLEGWEKSQFFQFNNSKRSGYFTRRNQNREIILERDLSNDGKSEIFGGNEFFSKDFNQILISCWFSQIFFPRFSENFICNQSSISREVLGMIFHKTQTVRKTHWETESLSIQNSNAIPFTIFIQKTIDQNARIFFGL